MACQLNEPHAVEVRQNFVRSKPNYRRKTFLFDDESIRRHAGNFQLLDVSIDCAEMEL